MLTPVSEAKKIFSLSKLKSIKNLPKCLSLSATLHNAKLLNNLTATAYRQDFQKYTSSNIFGQGIHCGIKCLNVLHWLCYCHKMK